MSSHPELAARIERESDTLVRRSIDAMAGDPFWDARFGARAAAVAQEDAGALVACLARALRAGDAEPVVTWARTLQPVAAMRGMTSRQLAGSFHRLADVIRDAHLPEAGAARTLLDKAVLALRYDGRPAAAVQDASRQLAEDAVVTLRGFHIGEEMIEAEWIEALEMLVSYLADAMALGKPELLAAHARWLAATGPATLRPAEPVAMIGALYGALDELIDPARSEASEYLAAARSSLDAAAA